MHSSQAKPKKKKTPKDSSKSGDSSWYIPAEELILGKAIGRGAFGVVRKAKWNGTTVAVKQIGDVAKGNSAAEFDREIAHMVSMRPHANVVLFYGVSIDSESGERAIVVEYCSGGNLSDALCSKTSALAWTEAQQIRVAFECACGVSHLHSNKIVHRDIAARNILLASRSKRQAKVADFGMARQGAVGDNDDEENQVGN